MDSINYPSLVVRRPIALTHPLMVPGAPDCETAAATAGSVLSSPQMFLAAAFKAAIQAGMADLLPVGLDFNGIGRHELPIDSFTQAPVAHNAELVASTPGIRLLVMFA